MAKGARASTRKRNNAALRAKIFGPAHDARTERLSARLQELASRPKPIDERAMDLDTTGGQEREQERTSEKTIEAGTTLADEVEIDVDAQKTTSNARYNHLKSKIEKKKVHRKARNSIVFPSITRKRKGPGMSKGKR